MNIHGPRPGSKGQCFIKKKKKKGGGRSRPVPYNLETEIHLQPGMLWF